VRTNNYPPKLALPLFLLFFWAFPHFSQAQFYFGHQMEFGQNRVQYQDRFWQYYRLPTYDVYYYRGGDELGVRVAEMAYTMIPEFEEFFEYQLDKRIVFMVYNRLSDFRQSNVGLTTGIEQSNIGGTTQIIDNKVFLYFEGSMEKFEEQVKQNIARVLLNEMIYNGNIRERVANSALINLPEWYYEGLVSYVANPWNAEIENRVREGLLSGRFLKLNQLQGEDARYAGHSIWHYIASEFGASVISNILYMTRVNKNIDSGLLFVLGLSFSEMTPGWLHFYRVALGEEAPLPPESPVVAKPKKAIRYQQARISPDGQRLAYSTNQLGRVKIFILNTQTGEREKVFAAEHKLNQILDYSYPLLDWHPSGRFLSFVTEEEDMAILYNYIFEDEELARRPLMEIKKVLDFAYSGDGQFVALSGYNRGQVDLFVYEPMANRTTQITNDLADDLNPRFINGNQQIVFSSDRMGDTIVYRGRHDPDQPVARSLDLFIYDYASGNKTLTRLTQTPYINESRPTELARHQFLYLTDRTGLLNFESSKFDSTISHIDTTTHYRYFSVTEALPQSPHGVLDYDYHRQSQRIAQTYMAEGRHWMDLADAPERGQARMEDLQVSPLIEKQRQRWQAEDQREEEDRSNPIPAVPSLPQNYVPSDPDTLPVNVNQYIFELERNPYNYALLADSFEIVQEEEETFQLPGQRNYQTTFFMNELVNQVDFSFLNATYQPFTGSAFYYTPNYNVLLKVGATDLFEDYRLIGGVRISGLEGNEFLLSFEDLSGRTDKQILAHRQFTSLGGGIARMHTHQGIYMLRHPLSQVLAVKGTATLRHDRIVFPSMDYYTLEEDNQQAIWGGLKAEAIFDNTRDMGMNLRDGFRAKIFLEYFTQLDLERTDLWVWGLDARFYKPIHRSLIWASRFAVSSSWGRSPLVYYLGAVDNWVNFSATTPTFNQEIPIDEEANYAYQTVATNMRGFSQNIRNGKNFAVLNQELRLPVARYLANRPINSDFLNNLQVVGFADAGSAWTGLTPFNSKNAYDTETLTNGPVTIIVDKNRPPVVFGYGFGLRSRLFGYFVRADWAWGVEGRVILPRVFYLSLSLDF